MNILAIIVLLALAWYSLETGMAFFAFLLFLAVILMLYTQKPARQSAGEAAQTAGGYQPVVIDSSPGPPKSEVRMRVKYWKDNWDGHPQEYMLMHAGTALSNVFRSVLYMFGIEKDQPKD